jgi:hypothetical protein
LLAVHPDVGFVIEAFESEQGSGPFYGLTSIEFATIPPRNLKRRLRYFLQIFAVERIRVDIVLLETRKNGSRYGNAIPA